MNKIITQTQQENVLMNLKSMTRILDMLERRVNRKEYICQTGAKMDVQYVAQLKALLATTKDIVNSFENDDFENGDRG